MFKSWRNDKNKIKAVFKLQFQATQVLCFVSLNLKTQLYFSVKFRQCVYYIF